jgi:hypothetical protein
MSKQSSILIKRYGAVIKLRAEIFIPKPVELLWPFFSDPLNLAKITPQLYGTGYLLQPQPGHIPG